MKVFFLLGLLAATAHAQSADLPNYLKDQLDESTASSAFQLTVNDTLEKISTEKNYRENVTTQVKRDLKGWEKTASVAEGTAGSLMMLGFPVAFTAITSGDEMVKSGSSVKHGVEVAHISGAAVGSSVVGGVTFAGLEKLVNVDVVNNVLNDTKADEYATSTASRLAKFFLLPKAKEMALKFAIKEEIYRKNKANDLTPMDIIAVLKSAKHAGQPILSENETQAFARVQAELVKTQGVKEAKDSKPKTPELSLDDKIGYLIGANAMLEVQLDMNKPKGNSGEPPEIRKIHAQVDQNRKLLREIQEYRKTEKIGSSKDAKDEDEKQPGAVDAE